MSQTFQIQRHRSTGLTTLQDHVAVEEPLEIRIEGRSIAVLMRQPNRSEDIELVTGFLLTEGVIDDASDISAIDHIVDPSTPQYNTVDVILAGGVPAKRRHSADRALFASSSCGICGKATQDRIWQHFPPLPHAITLPDFDWICQTPRAMRSAQNHFAQTGGTHAAALFDLNGSLRVLREDVGRHNAVDKVIGWAIQQDLDGSTLALLVSGRVAFEIAQKALAFRIPLLMAIGAPSSLAVELCQGSNLELLGFLKENGYNHYTNRCHPPSNHVEQQTEKSATEFPPKQRLH